MADEERVTPGQEHGIELPPFSIRHADRSTFLDRCADVQSEQLASQRGLRTPEESDAIEEHVGSALRLEPQHQVLCNPAAIGEGSAWMVSTREVRRDRRLLGAQSRDRPSQARDAIPALARRLPSCDLRRTPRR